MIKENLGLITALVASILWGINYVLFEITSKKVNVVTMLFIDYTLCFLITGFLCFFNASFKQDLIKLYEIKWITIINILVYLSATFLIAFSIKHSNSITAGLIEISYPLFIILFSYLLLSDFKLSKATLLGGLIIIVGLVIVMKGKVI